MEWKVTKSLIDQERKLKLPVLSKYTSPLKWCKYFKLFLNHTFGVRKVPLTYFIRDKVEVDPESPRARNGPDPNTTYAPLLPTKYFGSSGSVLKDLIKPSIHNHPL